MTEPLCGKKVLILGLGISGAAAFRALLTEGAFVGVYDDRDIEKDDPPVYEELKMAGAACFLNGTPVDDGEWDIFVLSPGVPPSLPFIEDARNRGVKIIGEIELAYILGHGKYTAITGTNGKTTTTTLIGEIFSAARLKTFVVGNIGTPVVSIAPGAGPDAWLVTEVSSFQLETIDRFKPKIAIFLNLTPDHMDRHGTMEDYAAAKARIFENQDEDDFLVYNADDELVVSLVSRAKTVKLPFSRNRALNAGAFVKDGQIVFAGSCTEGAANASANANANANADASALITVLPTSGLQIPGAHNLENALAATAAAFAAGIEPGIIAETLRNFKGVEHRIEFVAEIKGVRFVNDSKGTNPDASIKAIEAIEAAEAAGERRKILLIAGGYDKGADFTEFVRAAKGRVKKLLLLGATADKIRERARAEGFSDADIVIVERMGEAVRGGFRFAHTGDTVLLSPACASWDMYENYEERGADFKSSVAGLEAEKW